jgi:hypothetical protein
MPDSHLIREARKREIALSKRFKPKFWQEQDNRVAVVKEIRRRVETLKRDTGADSYQKQLLCERAIFVAIQLETMECDALAGKGRLDAGLYCQAVNTLSGLLAKLGLERKVQQAGDLKAFLKERA